MSGGGFKLHQDGREADYSQWEFGPVFEAGGRIRWSKTAAAALAQVGTGLLGQYETLLAGYGVRADALGSFADVTVGEQYAAGSQGLDVVHGISPIYQGMVVVVTASDNAADCGLYHISGYAADEIIIDRWLAGTTVSFTVYQHVLALGASGRIRANCTLTDQENDQDTAYSFAYHCNRGESTGLTCGLLVRCVGVNHTDTGWGNHYPLAIYRGLYHDWFIFNVDSNGVGFFYGGLGVGCVDPDGIFDVTPDTVGTGTYSYPFPRVTTAQRAAMEGMGPGAMIFDTTEEKLYVYKTAGWAEV